MDIYVKHGDTPHPFLTSNDIIETYNRIGLNKDGGVR